MNDCVCQDCDSESIIDAMKQMLGVDRIIVWYGKDKDTGKRNGLTYVVIWEKDMRYVGISKCQMQLDQYSKVKGRTIALNRAIFVKDVMDKYPAADKLVQVQGLCPPKCSRRSLNKWMFAFSYEKHKDLNAAVVLKTKSSVFDVGLIQDTLRNMPLFLYVSKKEIQ